MLLCTHHYCICSDGLHCKNITVQISSCQVLLLTSEGTLLKYLNCLCVNTLRGSHCVWHLGWPVDGIYSLRRNVAVVVKQNSGGPRSCTCNSTFDWAEGVTYALRFGFCDLLCLSRKAGHKRLCPSLHKGIRELSVVPLRKKAAKQNCRLHSWHQGHLGDDSSSSKQIMAKALLKTTEFWFAFYFKSCF